MAVDVSKIPNSKNFDTVREAIIALDDSISDTGNSINNTQITISAGTNMSGGGVFTLNQSNAQTITLDADDQTMTDAEVKTAYENNSDTNAFTDAEKTKLGTVATNADVTATAITGISVTAHNDVTSAGSGQIITAAERTKLAGIEESADVTDTANVTTAINSISVTAHSDVSDAGSGQIITTTERTKLTNIEDNATADQTASEILTAIKTVDGTGSGLDADLLDGEEGSYYLDYANFSGNYTIDYDSSGNKRVYGILYYVGDETNINDAVTTVGTFDFTTNTLNLGANGEQFSEFPPDSASSTNAVFILKWSSTNTGGTGETARPVSGLGTLISSTQFSGPVTFRTLESADATVIDGSNITTGSIQSAGYDAGATATDFAVSGTKLFLTGVGDNAAGDIISPQFKVTSGNASFKGSITSTSGSIGGWDIQSDAIVSPDDRIELNSDSGLVIKNSSGTPKLQIRSGSLTGLTSKTFTFSGLSTLEFNTFNDTLTSNSEDFLYNGTTSLSASANITSTNYGVYVEEISMNATPVGQTVYSTSSDFVGSVNVEVRMDIATDSSFSNILKTVVLQTAGTSSPSQDIDFVQVDRSIEININQNFTTAYMRVYYYRNVFIGAGSVDFDTGSSLTSFDFGQTNGVFAKTINQTELTDEGFQVIYDSNNYLKTSTVSASSEFVEIEGGLNLDGIALNVQNYASRTAAHSDTVTANFYQRLSDTCIMQWGYVNGTLSNPTTTFPLTFPKACRSVHVSTRRTSSSGSGTNYVYSVTASSFRAVIEDSNGQGRDFFWMAFGD